MICQPTNQNTSLHKQSMSKSTDDNGVTYKIRFTQNISTEGILTILNDMNSVLKDERVYRATKEFIHALDSKKEPQSLCLLKESYPQYGTITKSCSSDKAPENRQGSILDLQAPSKKFEDRVLLVLKKHMHDVEYHKAITIEAKVDEPGLLGTILIPDFYSPENSMVLDAKSGNVSKSDVTALISYKSELKCKAGVLVLSEVSIVSPSVLAFVKQQAGIHVLYIEEFNDGFKHLKEAIKANSQYIQPVPEQHISKTDWNICSHINLDAYYSYYEKTPHSRIESLSGSLTAPKLMQVLRKVVDLCIKFKTENQTRSLRGVSELIKTELVKDGHASPSAPTIEKFLNHVFKDMKDILKTGCFDISK